MYPVTNSTFYVYAAAAVESVKTICDDKLAWDSRSPAAPEP